MAKKRAPNAIPVSTTNDRLLNLTEAALRLRMGESTLRWKLYKGLGPRAFKLPGSDQWRFRPADLDAYVDAAEVSAANAAEELSVDQAIRRRFNMLPFVVKIPDAEIDKDLTAKLEAEWPGILAQMIAGCIEWQRIGLAPPKAITDATEKYLEEEDAIGKWSVWSRRVWSGTSTAGCRSTACISIGSCGPTPTARKPIRRNGFPHDWTQWSSARSEARRGLPVFAAWRGRQPTMRTMRCR